VSLFGYGIGVHDLNAVESNDAPEKPNGGKALREQVRVSRAQLRRGPVERDSRSD